MFTTGRKYCLIFLISMLMLPNLALAQTSSLNVEQPVDIHGSQSQFADHIAPLIFNVSVKTNAKSAVVFWQTDEISLGKVAWGKSDDVGDGQITVEKYDKKHSAEILNLEPQANYHFTITAIDQAGNQRVYQGTFVTLAEPDLTAPQNVTNFTATPNHGRIILSWQNPADKDFAKVRIVRSERFFPPDPGSGLVIYEGTVQETSDGAVNPGITYYYSIFAADRSGNYSPGAIVIARILPYSQQIGQNQNSYSDAPVVDFQFPQAPQPPSKIVNFRDFTIVYNHGSATVDANNPKIPAGSDITLRIPYALLPEGTKLIVLGVKDQNNVLASYLFSFDKTTKEFFATIPPAILAQLYHVSVTIFNNLGQVISTVAGSFEIFSVNAKGVGGTAKNPIPWWAFIFSVVVFVPIYFLVRMHYRHAGPVNVIMPQKPRRVRTKPKTKFKT